MTSNWIKELEDIYADGGDWNDMLPVFERVDKLLRLSKAGTDDEALLDEIWEEIKDE